MYLSNKILVITPAEAPNPYETKLSQFCAFEAIITTAVPHVIAMRNEVMAAARIRPLEMFLMFKATRNCWIKAMKNSITAKVGSPFIKFLKFGSVMK